MKIRLIRLLVFLSCLSLPFSARSCFILFLSDGREVLVGNHEDWFAHDAAVKIQPPSSGRYGSVIFTFMSEGWAQGGMNERGLFFDGAFTPYQEITFDSHARKSEAFIWQAVLDKCATVKEALELLSRFELPELQEAHIMLADATGAAVILGVKDGRVAIKKVEGDYLLQTNFNPWHPELSDERCWRYDKASNLLKNNREATQTNMLSILQQTHQDSLTIYSNIYDLKSKTVHTYSKRDFSHPVSISLPEYFKYGECMQSLDELLRNASAWKDCVAKKDPGTLAFTGKVIDKNTKEPVPYANIGLFGRNIGTLSDPDGRFELIIPAELRHETVLFSSIGFDLARVYIQPGMTVELRPNSRLLEAVTVSGNDMRHRKRLGWMGGKDGSLPFDTIQGGGAVALLVESPSATNFIEKLQVRLMYNSKDTLVFRLHLYAYDSLNNQPGRELLQKEILLKETKRYGWLHFPMTDYAIAINERRFCVGFEWIDNLQTRKKMLKGLQDWNRWKINRYKSGDKKMERIIVRNNEGKEVESYKYHGNMMNWPGFKDLPPFTGLMVETGKHNKTLSMKTFERKTSFGKWTELASTLNAVITLSY